MADTLYEDEKCTYCWGDPRFEDRFVTGSLTLAPDGVSFVAEQDSIVWPKAAIKSVKYAPTHPVDLEEIARTQGVEAAQDIEVGLAMDVAPEPALSIVVHDPEGVEPDGFDVRILFRNQYYAKVFAKRVSTTFGVPFKDTKRT